MGKSRQQVAPALVPVDAFTAVIVPEGGCSDRDKMLP